MPPGGFTLELPRQFAVAPRPIAKLKPDTCMLRACWFAGTAQTRLCSALRRAKRAVQAAMRADADDAVDNMQLVDEIYEAAGMPVRQPSSYFLPPGSATAGSQLPAGTKCGGHTALHASRRK